MVQSSYIEQEEAVRNKHPVPEAVRFSSQNQAGWKVPTRSYWTKMLEDSNISGILGTVFIAP